MHHHFVSWNAKSFYCFSSWQKAGLHFQCTLKNIYHEQTTNELFIILCALQRACTKQLYAALQRISVNADSSTPLKCLASGIKSVEQPHPSTPWQTSVLELLVFCYFCILLVYPGALFYAMLI